MNIVGHACARARLRGSGISENGLSLLQLVLFHEMPYRHAELVSSLMQQHLLDVLQCSSCKESKYPDTIMVERRPTSAGKHTIHFRQSPACGCTTTCAPGTVVPLIHAKIENLVLCLERLFPRATTPCFKTQYEICTDLGTSPITMWCVHAFFAVLPPLTSETQAFRHSSALGANCPPFRGYSPGPAVSWSPPLRCGHRLYCWECVAGSMSWP